MFRSRFLIAAGSLAIANVISRLAVFAALIVLARQVALDSFGELSVAVALAAAGFAVSEWGMDTIAVRTIARRPERAGSVVASLLLGRVATTILAFSALLLYSVVFLEPEVRDLTVVVVFGSLLSSLAKSGRVPFIAFDRISVEAVIGSGERILVLLLVLVGVVVFPGNVWVFAWAVCIAAALSLFASWDALARNVTFRWTQWARRARRMVWAATPIGLNALAVWIYYRASLVILMSARGSAEAGLLGAISLVTTGFGIATQSIVQILIPRLARMRRNSEVSSNALQSILSHAAIVAGALAVSLAALSGPLLKWVFGSAYLPATSAFALLSAHVFFIVLTPVAATILRVYGHQSVMLAIAIGGACGSLIAAAITVPAIGLMGAVISILVGECLVLVGTMVWIVFGAKIVKGNVLIYPAAFIALTLICSVVTMASTAGGLLITMGVLAIAVTKWRSAEISAAMELMEKRKY
jgi:O-antigen/teichoic acid export membrane protein